MTTIFFDLLVMIEAIFILFLTMTFFKTLKSHGKLIEGLNNVISTQCDDIALMFGTITKLSGDVKNLEKIMDDHVSADLRKIIREEWKGIN